MGQNGWLDRIRRTDGGDGTERMDGGIEERLMWRENESEIGVNYGGNKDP